MTWYTIRRDSIDKFKADTPNHDLPENFESLSVEVIDSKVHDLYGFDDEGQSIWLDNSWTSPLDELVQICVATGDITDNTFIG